MSKRLLSAEYQSYHGVGTAVYFIYIYIFLTVVIEECDGPRAFVLRWGGAEEANQRDHGHLAGAEVLASCRESHGSLSLPPSSTAILFPDHVSLHLPQ